MAETILTSPGVTTREIDLSGPANAPAFGVPAGVIGTANRGPAFVPVTFGSRQDFFAKFGETDGEKFGPIAVSEWMRNATAGSYLRVLGAGDGLQRSTTTGKVTNAGFTVGARQVQSDGLVDNNAYAVEFGIPGNVHFLATAMSESAGTTMFSEAGLQDDASSTVILRGVLMAASGVVLRLSGTNTLNNTPTDAVTTATAAGPRGGLTGSVDVASGSSTFVMLLNGHISTAAYPNVITASFSPSSPSYFAKLFNKDATKAEQAGHLLYSHYDIEETICAVTGSGLISNASYLETAPRRLEDIVFLTTGSADLGAGGAGKPEYKGFENRFTTSKSPWVISQANVNLFKIHALDDGQIKAIASAKSPVIPGSNDRYKISIRNLKKSSSDVDLFGTFDIIVRDFYDTDAEPIELETFSGLSLDPTSPNYLAARIGDISTFFDFDKVADEQRLVVEGSFPNVSSYIRLELSQELAAGDTSDDSLPVGFRGIDHLILSGTTCLSQFTGAPATYSGVPSDLGGSPMGLMNEPPVPFRQHLIANHSGTINSRIDSSFYWGIQFEKKLKPTGPNTSKLPDPTLASMTSFMPNFRLDATNASTGSNPGQARLNGGILDADLFNNNKFTLLNLKIVTGSDGKVDTSTAIDWTYVRQGSITPSSAAKTRALSVDTDFGVSSMRRFLKFSFMVQGGFNGLDMFNENKVKMNNTAVRREMDDVSGESQKSSSTVAAYLKGLDIMGRTSDVSLQLLAIPGIRHSAVTDEAINTVENRFDAMYIMDIEERDTLNTVVTSSAQVPHVQNTATAFGNRGLDSSFAAAYFPNVTMLDPTTGALVEVPPSVAVLGAFSLNDKLAHPWFAPAGFTRGALVSTQDVSVRINQDNQDRLYEADINPIRTFPGRDGVNVFGQKTLQQAQSALDRINVRRLLIDVRRQVRNIANRFLFEPNRETTLNAFSAAVQPLMQRIQQQQGVDRYKVLIDTSTTTQADVENNTIRGKIFLQPTRSIEFVSLDFVVTNAGAEE